MTGQPAAELLPPTGSARLASNTQAKVEPLPGSLATSSRAWCNVTGPSQGGHSEPRRDRCCSYHSSRICQCDDSGRLPEKARPHDSGGSGSGKGLRRNIWPEYPYPQLEAWVWGVNCCCGGRYTWPMRDGRASPAQALDPLAVRRNATREYGSRIGEGTKNSLPMFVPTSPAQPKRFCISIGCVLSE